MSKIQQSPLHIQADVFALKQCVALLLARHAQVQGVPMSQINQLLLDASAINPEQLSGKTHAEIQTLTDINQAITDSFNSICGLAANVLETLEAA